VPMDKDQAEALVLRKENAMRLQYEEPPRTVYIWVDSTVGSEYLDFGTVELVPGAHTPNHAHALAEEVMWVHHGRGVATINGEDYQVEEGMVVFAPPGVRHCFSNTGDEMMTIAYAYSPSGSEAQFRLREEGIPSSISSADLPAPGTAALADTK
jgi:quercetin dioxygenase-like cupin family protein